MSRTFSKENERKLYDGAVRIHNLSESTIPDELFSVFRDTEPIKNRTYVKLIDKPKQSDKTDEPDVAPAVPPAVEQKHEPLTDDQFWNLINKLNWRDSDEKKYNQGYVHSVLNYQERSLVKTKMHGYMAILGRQIGDSSFLQDKTTSFKCNFYSHIIGKGVQFYNLVLTTPDLSLYMLATYQPLYMWL